MGKILSFFGSTWIIPAILAILASGGGIYVASLKHDVKVAKNAQVKAELSLRECQLSVNEQNQRIEMSKEEARIMGENLARHRAKAASDRLRGDKRSKAILAAPSEKTCQKAVGKAVRGIQERYKSE